jgi:hypothetical protein
VCGSCAAAGAGGPFAFGVGLLVACACSLLTVVASEIYFGVALRDCPDTGTYDSGCRQAYDERDFARGVFAGSVLLGAAGGMAGAGVAGWRFGRSFLARVGTLPLACAAAVSALVILVALVVPGEP